MKRYKFLVLLAVSLFILLPTKISALDYDWKNPMQPNRMIAGPTESEPWGELESTSGRNNHKEELSNWQMWWISLRLYFDVDFPGETTRPVIINVKSAVKIEDDQDVNVNQDNIEENADSHSGTDPS